MIKHKSDLLKSLKKFRKEADKKVLYKVLHNLYSWKTPTATGIVAMAMDFMLPLYWMNVSSHLEISGNQVEKVLLSLVISSLFLLSYLCLHHLPSKKDKILRNVHPEMNYIE